MKKLEEFKKLQECQYLFFDKFDYFISSFASEVQINYIEHPLHIEQIILLKNILNNKIIYYSVSFGVNVEGKIFCGFRFYIQRIIKNSLLRNEFSIIDFINKYNLKNEIEWFKLGEFDLVIQVNTFITEVNEIIYNEKMLQVLFSDEWLDIPINMEPYK